MMLDTPHGRIRRRFVYISQAQLSWWEHQCMHQMLSLLDSALQPYSIAARDFILWWAATLRMEHIQVLNTASNALEVTQSQI